MDKQSSNQQSVYHPIKRFVLGALVGIFFSLIYWFYSIYAHSPPSIAHGCIGSIILAIACGAIATFTSFEKLMDNFPPI